MEVIILAGGMGTRLRHVVSDVPKPMAPVNGLPFVEHVVQWAIKYKVDHIIFSVSYKAEIIKNHFKSAYNRIAISYAHEHELLGTGGGIRYALNYANTNDVLVLNGDTYFPIDLRVFYDFHVSNNHKVSVALKRMTKFDRYGTVDLADDTIISFNEKQYKEDGLINAGIYMLNKTYIVDQGLPEVFSFEKEILEKKCDLGVLKGMEFSAPFIDMGIPEDYNKAAEML
jgi:D-glycero-alpha-D-manno-heptose 1-phosphate guanylyltransferase